MLAEERYGEILRIVNEEKAVTVQKLTELLDTSESTIRRDLTTLHKRGELIKVHGGATAIESGYMTRDAELSVRSDLNREAKMKIGKYAATLVKEDDFVNVICAAFGLLVSMQPHAQTVCPTANLCTV